MTQISVNLERKIATNGWIIKARWFYLSGVLLIGALTKTISNSNVDFSVASMAKLAGIFILFNIAFHLGQKKVEKNFSLKLLNFIGYSQITIELLMLALVVHFGGGIESVSIVFFFMPVASSALLFGSRGSILTALASSFLINFLIIAEYFGIINHVFRYGLPTVEFSSLPIGLTKSITISIFYVIVGIFTGYGANQLFKREKSYEEKSAQLDVQAKKLIKREKELVLTNREIVEERNKTLAIINNFIDPIIVLGKYYRIAMINPAATKVFGLSDANIGEVVTIDDGFSMANFKTIIKKDFEIKEIVKAKEENQFVSEEVIIMVDGQEATYKVITAKVLGNNNELIGIMKIFYNLTREKAIDKMKSEFISIAAHQLRTPLSAIKWVIKMILDGDAGKLSIEQQDLLNKGYVSNERIIRLVNDLLNVSRIEEGRFGYNFETTNFQEVLSAAIGNLEGLIAKNYQELKVEKPNILPDIYMDKERITMVMQNILDNAIKYTPEYGRIEIIIKVDKQFLHVKIKDQGVGVPKSDQAKLFSKFFRANNAVRLATEGTGLGLFIARDVIEKHNGTIGLKSEEGHGTEVSFSLPIKTSQDLPG